MKQFLLILSIFILQTACTRDQTTNPDCTIVSITNSAPGCGGWGIKISGIKYPSRNIPDQFKQDGLTVCTVYELYEDKALCPCCGGTWASVISMTLP